MVQPAAKADPATQKRVADKYEKLSDREKWTGVKDEPEPEPED